MVRTIVKYAEDYDEETEHNLNYIQKICRLLATRLKADSKYSEDISHNFIKNLYKTSRFHDIGKLAISDEILRKPGKLTEDEFDIVKLHPTIGARIFREIAAHCSPLPLFKTAMNIILYHHEKWDGSGYPKGIAGESIPLEARIVAVADVYDAVRSKRCYKQAYSHESARVIINKGKGSHFDPIVVDTFMSFEAEIKGFYANGKYAPPN